jgi:hypothetical protein
MPSIINSDDGVVSGSAGLKTSGANDGITVFQQNGTESMRIGSNGAVTLALTLPVASGGTGATTLAANNVLLGNGTAAVQVVAPSTTGNVLTSNGTTWTSAPVGGGFPAGTLMLFQQTAAPTGWTKQTTHDNKALRVVSGAAGTGGSVAFTTAFASQSVAGTVGATTLSTSQIPSHTHNVSGNRVQGIGGGADYGSGSGGNATSSGTGGGGSHDHTFTGSSINLAVSYVDLIIASKT